MIMSFKDEYFGLQTYFLKSNSELYFVLKILILKYFIVPIYDLVALKNILIWISDIIYQTETSLPLLIIQIKLRFQ